MNRRPRFLVLLPGLCVMWTVLWYVDSGDYAIAVLSAAAVIAACIPSRPFKPNARYIIWTWVFMLIVSMAANIDRIIPGKTGFTGYFLSFYNRTTTISFSIALAALFFRPSPFQSSAVMAGCVPMLMMTIIAKRAPNGGTLNPNEFDLLIWGTLALFFICAQIIEMTQNRDTSLPRAGFREFTVRILISCAVFAGAFFFTPSVGRGFEKFTQRMLSWMNDFGSRLDINSGNRLGLESPPEGFGGMIRPLIAISAPERPGYIRESVFNVYDGGTWIRGPGAEPEELSGELEDTGTLTRFDLPGSANERKKQTMRWRYGIIAPWKISGFCLPGGAVSFSISDDADDSPLFSEDGIAAYENSRTPQFIYADVKRRGGGMPWPSGGAVTNYTLIPVILMPAVSNWVAACPGLTEAKTDSQAAAAVLSYFKDGFEYKLGTGYGRRGRDPLEDFMEEKRGHCTLFASAAALMLRMKGVPVRVVGGYYCSEIHPWTGEWIIRERDGHAWCEVLERDTGRWTILDATPPAGIPGEYEMPGFFDLAAEWTGHFWRLFRARIQENNPLILIADAGSGLFTMLVNLAISPVGAVFAAAVALLIFRRMRRQAGTNENEKLRMKLTAEMKKFEKSAAHGDSGLRRRIDEPWSDWSDRISSSVPPESAEIIARTTAEYESLRYRKTVPAESARTWLSRRR